MRNNKKRMIERGNVSEEAKKMLKKKSNIKWWITKKKIVGVSVKKAKW